MATDKGKSTGSKGGSVSLAEEDRRYLTETMGDTGDIDGNNVMEALETFGLSSERVQRLFTAIADIDVKASVDKASEYLAEQINSAKIYAKENPKKVGGVATGVLVGASLLALALRRAADDKKGGAKKSSSPAAPSPSTSSSKKSASKKSSGGSKKSVTVTASSSKKSSGGSKKRRR